MDEPRRPGRDLYDEDFFRWTQDQAAALRRAGAQRVNAPLDWENLAEEIESLGKRDRREVRSLLHLILLHLAKLALSRRSEPRRGWIAEVRAYRGHLERVLADSPSLAAQVAEIAGSERERVVDDVEASLREHGEFVAPGRVEAFLAALDPAAILDQDHVPEPSEPAR